ncbi:MAG: dUTP diphosphatase [Bacilli bacterium]
MKTNQRIFEVVSSELHKEGIAVLPKRGTSASAGYDFALAAAITLQPGERKLAFTNICANMNNDDVLEIFIRSSIAIKKGVVLANGTGIIDADYYPNNIGLPLWNTTDQVVHFEQGERVAQGIFKKYLVTQNDDVSTLREGGFGSTGKG